MALTLETEAIASCCHTFCRYCALRCKREFGRCPICRTEVPGLYLPTGTDGDVRQVAQAVRTPRDVIEDNSLVLESDFIDFDSWLHRSGLSESSIAELMEQQLDLSGSTVSEFLSDLQLSGDDASSHLQQMLQYIHDGYARSISDALMHARRRRSLPDRHSNRSPRPRSHKRLMMWALRTARGRRPWSRSNQSSTTI